MCLGRSCSSRPTLPGGQLQRPHGRCATMPLHRGTGHSGLFLHGSATATTRPGRIVPQGPPPQSSVNAPGTLLRDVPHRLRADAIDRGSRAVEVSTTSGRSAPSTASPSPVEALQGLAEVMPPMTQSKQPTYGRLKWLSSVPRANRGPDDASKDSAMSDVAPCRRFAEMRFET